MKLEQLLAEVQEANLSNLLLAQSLIRADREQALYRLGISEETANLLTSMTPTQVVRAARTNTLLFQFRPDEAVFTLLTGSRQEASNDTVSRMHAAILQAGRHQEAA